MDILTKKDRLLIFFSATIGIISTAFCGSHHNMLALWGLMPFLYLEAESKHSACLAAFTFYLAISRGIVPGAYVFFQDGSLIRALTLWILSAAALSAPWRMLWSAKHKACRVVLAVLVSIPPPLGLIGWGNPLTAAGLFFPGFGWYGLALTLTLYAGGAIFSKFRRTLVILVMFAVPFLDVPAISERVTVGNVTIQGVNTSFGRIASGSGDFDSQYQRERKVFHYIYERKREGDFESADVVVLPETIIGRMNPTTMKRWEKFFTPLSPRPFAQRGVVFIAGGEIPANNGRKYDNVMASFEEERKRQMAKQRFPVPFSMFRPFSGEGANAYLSSLGENSIIEIHGKKLGFLVCYEQFLTWPFLSLLSRQPDVIIAPANLWWCKETSLPGIRAAALHLWTRSFSVPAVEAVNR